MRIFALETDHERLKKELLLEGEREVLCVGYHWLKFIGVLLSSGFITLCVAFALSALWYFSAPFVFSPIPLTFLALLYIWFVGFPAISAFVDFMYDHIIVTNSRIVIIDQASIFHRDIRKMDLENIASVRAKTQFMNIFPFGTLHFDLKEGVGKSLILKYIPHVDKVSSCISCCLRDSQVNIPSPNSPNV